MHTSQKSRWIVDAVLFTGFLAAFFLDLTGLPMHQWLGLAVAAVAAYHLFTHESWVNAVTSRFFGQLAARSRLYYLIDAALLIGFTAITATGLVISSWLNLQLASYDAWRFVHIAASIATLFVSVLKLALHWRWIVLVTKNIFAGQSALTTRPSAGAALLGRREFVRMMGVVGLGSTIALASSIQGLQPDGVKESTASAASTTGNPQAAQVLLQAAQALLPPHAPCAAGNVALTLGTAASIWIQTVTAAVI